MTTALDAIAQIINTTDGGQYGKVRAYAQTTDGVRVLRLSAKSVSAGKIAFERAAKRLPGYFDAEYTAPAVYEIRVRNTADRHIDKATGGYRDERTGDIVVTCTSSEETTRREVAAASAYAARIAHLNADHAEAILDAQNAEESNNVHIAIPDWTCQFVTATTTTDDNRAIVRYTSWRLVIDTTFAQRHPSTTEADVVIVADDQEHDCACLGCASVHGSACPDNSANLVCMGTDLTDEAAMVNEAVRLAAEQGFRVDGPWVPDARGRLTAPLVPVILDPDCAAYEQLAVAA